MLPVLLLAFILVPIAELALLIGIGGEIGLGWTVALLISSAVLGSVLLRWQGRAAWRAFTLALQSGRPPAREVLDGALVLVGGALLLTPGFLTDGLGLALIVPPTRAAIRALIARRLIARMTQQMTRMAERRAGRAPRRDADVEGTAREIDPATLEPRR